MQKNRYTRLADQERESISRGLAQHKPIRQIAKELDRFPSTISREVRRNRGKTGYRAFSASRRAKAAASSRKRGKRKIEKQEGLLSYVTEKLQGEWSPEEISKWLKVEYAWDINMQVSHEAIYQYIDLLPRGELKQLLIKGLRQERKHHRAKKRGDATETRGKIANMISIEEPPAELVELKVPCYLETYNSDNLGFYGSLGFKVVGSERASLHAPSAWGLLREPKEFESSSAARNS
jgi:IS30 family transposase